MKITELTEGISDVVYHVTQHDNALSILKSNSFQLRPTFAKKTERDVAKRKNNLYYMSTARNKNSRYIQDNGGIVFKLDGTRLRQRYSGAGIDYWGASFRDIEPNTEQEDRIFSQEPEIANARKYIDAIDIVMEFNADKHARKMLEIYSIAKKNGIDVNFYDSVRDRNFGRNTIDTKKALGEIKRKLRNNDNNRPYTPPRRSMHKGDTVVAVFLGLKFDDPENLPEGAEDRISKFIRSWGGIDQGVINADFHNAVSSERHRKMITQIVSFMKKKGFSSVEDLANHVYEKWKNKIAI